MNKLISTDEIVSLAKDYQIDPSFLKAILVTESSNTGFDPKTGKIKIQFEAWHYQEMTKKRIDNGVEVQSKEWAAFEQASALNRDAALLCTSWGLGQIMGFNFKKAGYDSVQEMVNEFQLSEFFQLQGMLTFIKNDPTMYNAIRTKNFRQFFSKYNGPKWEQFGYGVRFSEAYKSVRNGIIA